MSGGFTKRLTYLFSVFVGLLFIFPYTAQAVLPPDLIVSAGSQVVGIFSLLVAVVVSAVASFGMLYLSWFQWCKKWSVYIAFGVLAVTLLISNAVLLWMLGQNAESPSVPVFENPTATSTGAGAECITCQFYSDSITLFVPDATNPTVIELDLNRRQEPNQTYSHYYFLDGVVNGESLDRYIQFNALTRPLQPQTFLKNITRTEASDGSVRAVYSGQIETTEGRRVLFTTAALQGDFVTRNTPEYTQLQNTVPVEMSVDGVDRSGFALIETLHSNDFEKQIFFPGYDSLESLTHQLVLWDELGNFYMIDDSEVFSDTPDYPSHSWLLFKEASTGYTKKGFTTSITQPQENQWNISVPEFYNGQITVRSVNQYKVDVNGRTRHVVSGQVSDDTGVRTISGVLRVVR